MLVQRADGPCLRDRGPGAAIKGKGPVVGMATRPTLGEAHDRVGHEGQVGVLELGGKRCKLKLLRAEGSLGPHLVLPDACLVCLCTMAKPALEYCGRVW